MVDDGSAALPPLQFAIFAHQVTGFAFQQGEVQGLWKIEHATSLEYGSRGQDLPQTRISIAQFRNAKVRKPVVIFLGFRGRVKLR